MIDKINADELQALLEANPFQYLKLVDVIRHCGELNTVELRKMGFFSPAVLVSYARSKGVAINTERRAINGSYRKIAHYSLSN
jgi:hypothetical protein